MSGNLEKSIAALQKCRLTDIDLKSRLGSDYEYEISDYVDQWLDREGLESISDKKDRQLHRGWKSARAAFANNAEFTVLFQAAKHCWDAIHDAGRQHLLGQRADLEVASDGARPSSDVLFQPLLYFPADPPDSFNYYCKCLGGPHRAGAIILWWCAAAMSPQEFGYPQGFSNELIRQPIWFGIRRDVCIALQSPIELMVESAVFIAARSVGQNISTGAQRIEHLPFPDIVQVFGRLPELTPKQRDILNYCCKQHRQGRSIQIDHLMAAVWNEFPPLRNSLSGTISRLGRDLYKQDFKVHLGMDGTFIRFETY